MVGKWPTFILSSVYYITTRIYMYVFIYTKMVAVAKGYWYSWWTTLSSTYDCDNVEQ